MESGVPPARQETQGGMNNLDCNVTVMNDIRYVECWRDYETGDQIGDYTDFYQFVVGEVPLIAAFGKILDGQLIEHQHENAKVEYIYMSQVASELCGYADQETDGMTDEDDDNTWMIIGIVFIALFACMLGVVIYLCWKLKDKPAEDDSPTENRGGRSGYQQTGAAEDEYN